MHLALCAMRYLDLSRKLSVVQSKKI